MTIKVINPGAGINIHQSILDAISKASNGDTVLIPECNNPLIGTIATNKLIKLKGAGKDKTILYRPESIPDKEISGKPFFNFDIQRKTNSYITISYFSLKSKTKDSLATDYGIKINGAKNFKLFKCKFENLGHAGVSVKHYDDSIGGVIYGNDFINCAKGDGLGLGYGVSVYGSGTWRPDAQFGTKNFIFIEDNYFEGCRHDIAGGGSGCYVARKNKIKNAILSHAVDMHEARGPKYKDTNEYSTRACEIYDNEIHNTIYKDGHEVYNNAPFYSIGAINKDWVLAPLAIGIRGGESVIYNNNMSYFRRGIKIYASNNEFDPMIKTWIWDNKLESYGPIDKPYNQLFDKEAEIKEDVHYFLQPKENYVSYKYPHYLRT